MLAVCLRYCKSYEEAEDVLQEGFIKIFNNIEKYRMDGSFEGWIRRIMVNTAINNYHANLKYYYQENVDELEEVKDLNATNDDQYKFNGRLPKEKLMDLIQDLPDGYRMVFNMFAIEGFSHKEIADILDISVNTSKSQLSKARRNLKQRIKELEKKYNL
ncbi:MAG: RNA polymerase sigma factor [Bacteroidota bacterium]|nr:RNA polymerase sigma factor [Bacteroidota bacterium]